MAKSKNTMSMADKKYLKMLISIYNRYTNTGDPGIDRLFKNQALKLKKQLK